MKKNFTRIIVMGGFLFFFLKGVAWICLFLAASFGISGLIT